MATGTISTSNIGSGLDIDGIITKLMAIEKQPLTALQTTATTIDTKISAFATLTSTLSTLSDAAAALSKPATWSAKAVTSSNSTAVGASVSSGTAASLASYSVEVSQLARIQSVSSGAQVAGTGFGGGTLSIQLGTWGNTSGTPGASDFTAGTAAAVNLTVTQGETLTSIASRINALGAGVNATVMKDLSGERLVLNSKTTGEASGFRIQATSDGTPGADMASLAFDNPSAGTGMAGNPVQYALNATAKINGVAISSATNTMTDTIPGITFQLSQVTTSPVTIAVTPDNKGMRAALDTFVQSYNAMNTMLNSATKYDATAKTGALLQGDSATTGLQNALRNLIGASAGSGTLQNLSSVGITLLKGGNGNLTLDGTKADAALADPAAVQNFFVTGSGDGAPQGFGSRLAAFTANAIGSSGAFATRTASLQTEKTGNTKDQDRLNDRLTNTEDRLRKQYSTLDANLASLTALNTYVTQQIATWNKSTS